MFPIKCKSIGCSNFVDTGKDFCSDCMQEKLFADSDGDTHIEPTMAEKYPKYYKSVGDQTEIDVYAVHNMFEISDPSGCIQHASKKLLLSGSRTGGKSAFQDIKEARDTLTRWLQLNIPESVVLTTERRNNQQG